MDRILSCSLETELDTVEEFSGYFRGDAAWRRFVEAHGLKISESTTDCDVIKRILSVKGVDPEVWLSTSLPALDGLLPKEVMETHNKGHQALKAIIMRMP